MTVPRPCRYDSEHGLFDNPSALGAHYRAAHGDQYVQVEKPMLRCRLCGAPVRVAQSHFKARHSDVDRQGRPMTDWFERVDSRPVSVTTAARPPQPRRQCDLCGTVTRSDNMGRHFAAKHRGASWAVQSRYVVDSPTGLSRVDEQLARLDDTAPRHVGPWTVDDIVLPVVEQLAKPSGKVPVGVLAALFVWRDATAAMLREVTRA